jgi:hypothetical protein
MRNIRFWWIGLSLAIISIFLVGGALQATETNQALPQAVAELNAVPNQISYQGVYTQNGTPVTGSRDMSFRFHLASTCTTIPIWVTNLDDVSLQNGLFHVVLNVSPALFNGEPRWLRVIIDGEALGCEPILPAPYALHSASTGALHGRPVSADAPQAGRLLSWNGSEWVSPANPVIGQSGVGFQSTSANIGLRGHAVAILPPPNPDILTFGVWGRSDSRIGRGVYGEATASTGNNHGVFGTSASTSGRGVFGRATSSSGTNYGVYGTSSSSSGRGVYGLATGSGGATYGVYGEATGHEGLTRGVYGEGGMYGVYGRGNMGVSGIGYYRGVEGRSTGDAGGINAGVYGTADHHSAYAGYFHGRVHVTGDLSAGGAKSFKIDHPLDPANQYLYHFAVESPEVRNVYEGVATLDANGAVEVALPAYFTAVNTGDYRYQLTPLGAAMPHLHVAQEIEGNVFAIGGGEPGLRVSWQITAVRNDPYLRDHRPQAEMPKSEEEIGRYLYPQGYGQPDSLGMDYERLEALERSHE